MKKWLSKLLIALIVIIGILAIITWPSVVMYKNNISKNKLNKIQLMQNNPKTVVNPGPGGPILSSPIVSGPAMGRMYTPQEQKIQQEMSELTKNYNTSKDSISKQLSQLHSTPQFQQLFKEATSLLNEIDSTPKIAQLQKQLDSSKLPQASRSSIVNQIKQLQNSMPQYKKYTQLLNQMNTPEISQLQDKFNSLYNTYTTQYTQLINQLNKLLPPPKSVSNIF